MSYELIRVLRHEVLFRPILVNQTAYDEVHKQNVDKLLSMMKKNKKTLVIEHQFFNVSLNFKNKSKSHMQTGSSTKMKDTLDYRPKMRSGRYSIELLSRERKLQALNETLEITDYPIMDDSSACIIEDYLMFGKDISQNQLYNKDEL